MSDWPSFTVAELQAEGVLLVEDGNHGECRPRPAEFIKGGTAFVRAADLADGQVRFEGAGGIDDVALARIRKGVGRPCDLIFSHKGTVGKLARVPPDAPPFVCSPQTTFWRVLDESRLRRDYLYSYMRSRLFIDQWWARKGETDMADYVSLTAQRQLRVVVPPVDAQQRIAEPLAAIDDLIENNRRRVEVLDEMARAIYREWFVRFRYPGHENVPLVDSPLGPIPDGWSVAALESVADVNRRSRKPTEGEVIRYLDISALGDRTLDSLGEVSGGEAPGRARRVVKAGDVVWSMVRPNRRAHALLANPGPEWIASTGLAVLSATKVSSTWLFETTSTQEFTDYLVSQEGGAAYPAVNPKVFQRAPVVVPNRPADQLFSERVAPMHRLSWSLREQSVSLSRIRDLLLPKLVNGKIVTRLDVSSYRVSVRVNPPGRYSEAGLVEEPALELVAELGWEVVNAFSEVLGPAGTLGRDSMHEVVLVHRLRGAIRFLNPDVPDLILEEALQAVTKDRSAMDRVRANREVHTLLRDGYRAEWSDERGAKQFATVRFVDFLDSTKNDWLAASQVWFAGDLHRRRTDVVLFVNGIPLVLAEFKEPNRPAKAAFDENVTDYRDTIPALFVPNGFVICSNGSDAKVGSTYSPWEFFGDWKVIDADGTRGVVALETAIRGTCAHDRLLDLVENFTAFIERPGGLIKVVARNHQHLGVNAAIENLLRVRSAGGKRLGVFWHTQGSGKSLSMLWFTQKVLRRIPGAWTFVMVTDRTELDVQLHGEFADAGAISAEAQVHAGSAAHLRELLAADHRYVFTLIHKFRVDKAAGETSMPVLSDRSDVIVITDEAHRSQYDTLALNMRQALPNAAFMGFTGTPLIAGEELTRQQFGDYVSIYNFRDAIEDGSTVPLYYENRIPELQLVNEDFSDELTTLLEEAELDEDAEGQLARRFGREYTLLTRPERLRTISRDLVAHFVGRGFVGKAMYVGVDKAAAVRMYDYVAEAWAEQRAELQAQHDALPELERPWLASRLALMDSTEMAVVVSQSQNEIAHLERHGLDIRPHRKLMNEQDLAERFKAADDPLRIVFVCAMWMTGFDAPSVSTIYLDRPMRNHTLMQTIARANRVFPDKDNGLIVDYIGVFRNLEKALAIYGAANAESALDSPIHDVGALVTALGEAIDQVVTLCGAAGVDLPALRDAQGFEHIALRDAAVEALLADEDQRAAFLAAARQVRKLFKALLPDPAAAAQQSTVAAVRVLAERLLDLARPPAADLDQIADAVDELLDRSVGAEEYVIRAAAEGSEPEPLIDLSQIEFDALAARFAGRKRAETDRLAVLLKQRAVGAATRNPTRYDLVERIEELIAEYNAGSLNIDEYLRRLVALSKSLTDEEQRAVVEGLTEEELAIFDLLTKPDPVLTDAEREVVKASAKRLLTHLHDKLVLDWRRRAATTADVRASIRRILDADLPADPYPPEVFDAKVQAVFDHVATAYGDDGHSVYDGTVVEPAGPRFAPGGVTSLAEGAVSAAALTEEVVEQLRHDAEFVALVAEKLGLVGKPELRTIEELIDNDEDYAVEFKSTARWDLREGQPSKAMEDAIVKTVAAFLNTDGGTLLIGIGPDGAVVGLGHDYARVKPTNGDGFVNWLTTHLINALGHTPVTRTRARIAVHGGHEICRVDVAASPAPVWAKTSKDGQVFFVRMNNSTRALSLAEQLRYTASHWPG